MDDLFREDENQALIALIELNEPVETPNNNHYTFYPKDLAAARAYFHHNALDLEPAFTSLAEKGLLAGNRTLTPQGCEAARDLRRVRPPIWYFYQSFYRAIEHSQAFGEYCTQVFGLNLGQHGFSDMGQIERALVRLDLRPGERLLDIGCGNGGIAEYIAGRSGAHVTGIDNCPTAIEHALRRTQAQCERLSFEVRSLADLDGMETAFDAILSIDSIFFGESLECSLAAMKARLAPGGRMAVFCGDDLAPALQANGLAFEREDLGREHYAHLQRKHRAAQALREAFEAEGNGFVWENLATESLADDGPYDPARLPFGRWLYLISPVR